MFSNIFQNKKVLITGHTGFKGSWASIWLHHLGAKVIGVSDEVKTIPSNYELTNLKSFIKDYRINLTDFKKLNQIINENSPDFIFHFAAQAIVSKSFDKPLETYKTNTLGTVNMLEAIRLYKGDVITIFITSDKVYENVEWIWGYREIDQLGGKDPYSSSKAMAELAINSYFRTFLKYKNFKVAVGRAGNVIGGGDWSETRIIPDCIKAWSQNKKVKIKNLNSTRPWQFVLEPISGYFRLAQKLYLSEIKSGEAFNFGPISENNFTVEELVIEFKKNWKNVNYEASNDKIKISKEAVLLKLNCDKALNELKWKPSLNFKETVKMTADWYQEHYINKNEDMFNVTLKQIIDYSRRAKNKGLEWTN